MKSPQTSQHVGEVELNIRWWVWHESDLFCCPSPSPEVERVSGRGGGRCCFADQEVTAQTKSIETAIEVICGVIFIQLSCRLTTSHSIRQERLIVVELQKRWQTKGLQEELLPVTDGSRCLRQKHKLATVRSTARRMVEGAQGGAGNTRIRPPQLTNSGATRLRKRTARRTEHMSETDGSLAMRPRWLLPLRRRLVALLQHRPLLRRNPRPGVPE